VTTTVVVVLGALCGGFVTGLAGFGTGLTALGFWLHVVNPSVAAALVAVAVACFGHCIDGLQSHVTVQCKPAGNTRGSYRKDPDALTCEYGLTYQARFCNIREFVVLKGYLDFGITGSCLPYFRKRVPCNKVI